MRLGCFNQSLQSSITILKIAHFYLMPNKPNLMTVLMKNPKLVETKKVGFFFCPKKLAIMKLGLYFHLVIFPLPVVKMMLMLYFCNKTHVSCIINRYTTGLSHLAKYVPVTWSIIVKLLLYTILEFGGKTFSYFICLLTLLPLAYSFSCIEFLSLK